MSRVNHIQFQVSGDPQGPKLVFLHGLMGSAVNWRKVISAFQDRFQILVFDQRGHGRSFQPDSGYTPEDYAQDLKQILSQLAWDKIFLVGHSMGARNALTFASAWPERVIKLVLEDLNPGASQDAGRYIENILNTLPTPFSSRPAARALLLARFNKTLAEFLYTNLEQKNTSVDWRFSKAGILESIRAGRAKERWKELEQLSMPTLVVRGESSTDLPREIFLKMLQSNPKIKGAEIAGAGHWVHFDQPEAFIKTLDDFLTSHD